VAKTRRSKRASSTRGAKKGRRSAAKAAKPAGKKIELKRLQKQFEVVLGVLNARSATSPAATAKLDDTRRRIGQWMTDIDDICTPDMQEICGPSMAIPVP
jgi:hypothetical protein